jgi:succinate dehydrogenase / fumarate reductase iron-sulfur subunit
MASTTQATLRIWRGDAQGGRFENYTSEVTEGMVVLDVVHKVQAEQANDLAVRWNCKAGKCGSCSAEVNGVPRLLCMTRMSDLPPGETIIIEPMRAFPLLRDLVTNVSWNFEVKKKIKKFKPRPPDSPDGTWRMEQEDVDRVQEFRKCIECYLCQDVCHVIRDRDQKQKFVGPRFMIRLASLEMHPLDDDDRIPEIRKEFGSGMCNITRCCTEVCPESINITDNGIIPLKERVVDRYFDPVAMLGRKLFGIRKRTKARTE